MSISVISSIKNRSGYRIKNFLLTLTNQTVKPDEIIISDFSNEINHANNNRNLCKEYGVKYFHVEYDGHWNKPLALNYGIKNSSNTDDLMTADIDMVFKNNFIETVVNELNKSNSMVFCQAKILEENDVNDSTDIIKEFDKLFSNSKSWPKCGNGGIQATKRNWFFKVNGYDEEFFYWGCMDGDMALRAVRDGLSESWIENYTSMLHQWHLTKGHAFKNNKIADKCWNSTNISIKGKNTIIRNLNGWGDVNRIAKLSKELK